MVSLLLHVGLLGLAYIGWTTAPKPVRVTSVAVEILSDVTSQEMAPAPVDELAVNQPEPIPSEETVTPAPPEPDPQPVPAPQKASAPAKPDKKPEPARKDKAPLPDPKGQKKPTPDKKAAAEKTLDLDTLSATPSQSNSRRPPKANTQATNGQNQRGNADQAAGTKDEMDALTRRLSKLWYLNCDVPGTRQVKIEIWFRLSPNGRIVEGPRWANRRTDPVWVANANLAIAAVRRGEPYTDLPPALYNTDGVQPLFDAQAVCRGR
ncbi:hypothetical protein ABAC402_08440 [Asticcacaulis sp. AC402]|nr:hypothetical protein ABAC402_08440 [Asticcacaulis sp. AC402]